VRLPDNSDLQHWHDRAQEARAKAEQIKNPRSKRMMLGLADSYESLAQRIEQHAWKHTASSGFKLT
jgi:hypothetical protein